MSPLVERVLAVRAELAALEAQARADQARGRRVTVARRQGIERLSLHLGGLEEAAALVCREPDELRMLLDDLRHPKH